MATFVYILVTMYITKLITEIICNILNINSGGSIVTVTIIMQWMMMILIFVIFEQLGFINNE